jgi:hypothetical protein
MPIKGLVGASSIVNYAIILSECTLLAEVCMKYIIRHLLFGSFFIFTLLLVGICHADSRVHYSGSNGNILSDGEKMVLDAIVLRPIGLATTVAGTAIYTISLPFSLLGGNEPAARETLVKDPARYTFKRPLGELEY